jgi:hypothetical protein
MSTPDQEQHESRILINFDISLRKIQSVDIPYKATERYFLEYEDGHHYYTVSFSIKTNLIYITKHTRGILVPTYEDHFSCSPPRNKGDTIYFDCNGMKGNIYAWVR